MNNRKRDTASGDLSNRSNIARAMRVRMLKVPTNLAPPETSFQTEANPVRTNVTFYFGTIRSIAPSSSTNNKGNEKDQNFMDLKMTIHPANRQIRAHLNLHSPAGNVVLAMSNQTLCIPNNR